MRLSQALEDYLKVIYVLEADGEKATTTAIAQALDVSNASVTNMLKKLAGMNLIVHESYKGAELSPAGKKVALEILRHHRLLELYLKEVMGYSWDEVHDEAEKLEHHISEQFEDRIAELLNHPTSRFFLFQSRNNFYPIFLQQLLLFLILKKDLKSSHFYLKSLIKFCEVVPQVFG